MSYSTFTLDLNNMQGFKIGRWTVGERAAGKGPTYWHCVCVCGTERDIRADSLRQGRTKSCGCHRKDRMKEVGKMNRASDNSDSVVKPE